MSKYCFVKGSGSKVENYLEPIKDKFGEEKVDVFSSDEELKSEDNDLGDYKTVVLLGSPGKGVKEYLESVDEINIISENGVEGFLDMGYEDKVAETVYNSVKNAGQQFNAEKFKDVITSYGNLGIVLHDSPDPDAISSGLGVKQICENYGVDVEIFYSGSINHQENKALVNRLDLDLKKIDVEKYLNDGEKFYNLSYKGEEFSLQDYDGVMMVDTTFTNSKMLDTEEKIVADIVVDHHSGWEEFEDRVGRFFDVRTERGATASIIIDYMKNLGIQPEQEVATAMVHGIMTDTLDLDPNSRDFITEDIENLGFVHKFSDESSLMDIKNSSISTSTADVLAEAISNRTIDGTNVYSYLGRVEDIDAIPQASDYLKRFEGVSTSIAYGLQDDNIKLSARNSDIKINIGEELEKIFENGGTYGTVKCSAGGSTRKGGATIPLEAMGMIGKAILEGDGIEEYESAIESSIETMLRKIGSS